MPRIKPGPPCVICGEPSIARELCDKHYRRWRRHGHTNQTRPETWGQKHKHPLWDVWKQTKRVGRVSRWDDFWKFVEDVGDRPERARLYRRDVKAKAGPTNCYWSVPSLTAEELKDKARRQRQWRADNPLRAKGYDLKRTFGISLDEYQAMLVEQDGKCAICGQKDQWFSLAVDHCHGTKRVRGLLCSQCNRGLGLFRDKPELLENAARYLRHPTRLL